jgi:NAD(P)-dependent dehydrogenase (short-subunit alcohol dehydrogenase family)
VAPKHYATFDLLLQDKVAFVTGAGGAICGEIAKALAEVGVSVAICDIRAEAAERTAKSINDAGGKAIAVPCDAADRTRVDQAVAATVEAFGTIDILINGAGGSQREATTSEQLAFFNISPDAIIDAISMNYMTAVIPSQVVGRLFAEREKGVVLNVSSIAGLSPLTRSVAYSNAKAAMVNFTQWLAVHMAREYSPTIRVNSVAPGFVLTEQNRFLLVDERTGQATERGKRIIAHVPMGRYGEPWEMIGAVLWLVSDSASFVTGAVVPVDGGYSAFSGV